MDFDANCGFVYHYSARTIEKLVCDSPLGDGRLRLKEICPAMASRRLSLELQKIPAQAILDALRTVRQEVGAGLEADGTLSGKLSYDATCSLVPAPEPAKRVIRQAGSGKTVPSCHGSVERKHHDRCV